MTIDAPGIMPALRGLVAEVLPRRSFVLAMEADAPLSQAGLDSLRTVELVSALEERFGIRLEDDDLRDEYFTSLSGLSALLDRKGVR